MRETFKFSPDREYLEVRIYGTDKGTRVTSWALYKLVDHNECAGGLQATAALYANERADRKADMAAKKAKGKRS